MTFCIPIPYDKPGLNGVIYTKEAVEKAITDMQSGMPIVYRGDVSQNDVCLGVTTGDKEVKFDDDSHVCELTVAGIIRFGGTDCMAETNNGVVSSMKITSFGLSI